MGSESAAAAYTSGGGARLGTCHPFPYNEKWEGRVIFIISWKYVVGVSLSAVKHIPQGVGVRSSTCYSFP